MVCELFFNTFKLQYTGVTSVRKTSLCLTDARSCIDPLSAQDSLQSKSLKKKKTSNANKNKVRQGVLVPDYLSHK